MNEALRNEILSRWQAGTSQRRIARSLQVSRHTVAQVLAEVARQRDGQTPARRRRVRNVDAYAGTVQELLARYPAITARRLFEELQRQGYPGSYSRVRVYLREVRPRATPQPVVRFETGPGAQAQMDYSPFDLDFSDEGRRRVYLFSYLLSYSRRQYLRFVETQDFATTVREHLHAFTHLGGVAATCLYDNMKVVVSRYEDGEPIYNPSFLAFATHYGFRPVACRPYRPQTKGKVERPFDYVAKNLLNARTFQSLGHLNEVTAGWLAEVADVRVHATTKKTPLELHALEQPHLLPLPACPFEYAPVLYRTVNVEGFLSYRHNQYSVPWRYLGQLLPVRVTEAEVIIYDPHLEEIARHVLLPASASGQKQTQPAHHPSADPQHRGAMLHERFCELGPVAERFWDGLLRNQTQGKHQAQRVLALLSSYTRADVLAALERAVRYGAYSHAAVERILAVQAQPKSVLDTLAEGDRAHLAPLLQNQPVPPRPLHDYEPLLTPETTDHEQACEGQDQPERDDLARPL
jgi:transposase